MHFYVQTRKRVEYKAKKMWKQLALLLSIEWMIVDWMKLKFPNVLIMFNGTVEKLHKTRFTAMHEFDGPGIFRINQFDSELIYPSIDEYHHPGKCKCISWTWFVPRNLCVCCLPSFHSSLHSIVLHCLPLSLNEWWQSTEYIQIKSSLLKLHGR